MKSSKNCIFCGKPADTREHIPAKQLFKGTPAKNLITVPSCTTCNKSFQKDEDFFRQFYVSMIMSKSPGAKSLFENEISRAILRSPKLARQMFSQMKLVDFYTKSGVYLGKKTAYKVSDMDKQRIDRVVRKIIQGLFFYRFGASLPKDWIIKIVWITPKVEKDLKLQELASTLTWDVIKEDGFAYGVQYVPDTFQSIWILDFFKVPLFYVLVLDRKTAAK